MRLIDADALKVAVRQKFKDLPSRCEINGLVNAASTIDAIPVEWLEHRREGLIFAAMTGSQVYGNNVIELCHAINMVLDMWQMKQEAR